MNNTADTDVFTNREYGLSGLAWLNAAWEALYQDVDPNSLEGREIQVGMLSEYHARRAAEGSDFGANLDAETEAFWEQSES